MDGSAAGNGHHGDHPTPHLPPNSWIPLSVALALMVLLVGLLPPLGPWVGIVGGIWLLASCIAWLRAARSEYYDLPESGGD